MVKKKITIDPGHGGVQPGAVGSRKIPEKTITLAIALKVGAHLARCGQAVNYTRTSDVDVSLAQRCAIANNAKADYFVSIHCNSFSSSSAHGTETWCFAKGKPGESLAKNVQAQMVADIKLTDRGVKPCGNGLYVISKTNMPAILVEIAFISNPTEEAILLNPAYQSRFAEDIAKGILKEIRAPWVPETTAQPAPAPAPAPVVTPSDPKDEKIKELTVQVTSLAQGNTLLKGQLDAVVKDRDGLKAKIEKVKQDLQ